MSRPLNDTPYLYGLHDPGGEQIMLSRNVAGWVLVTVAIGHDPNDQSPGDDHRFQGDYRTLSDQGLGVVVRLNNSYAPGGTLPYEESYGDFARRCANFVRISRGCHLWIVGNETNHPVEWPGADWDWNAVPPVPKSPDKKGQKITPQRYGRCYRQVRDAIKAQSGHEDDQVLVAGVAPWNNLTTYAGNPDGDWVTYFQDVLDQVGAANCDGITLHAYTHGQDPALVTSDEKAGDPRFQTRHWHFRTYRDFMGAIPSGMRHLPVYITETDQGDVEWKDQDTGWVRKAYQEIDDWNQGHAQQIRALILYRWPKLDRWYIEGKSGVIRDFQQSLAKGFTWHETPPGPDLEVLMEQVDALTGQVNGLASQIDEVAQLAPQAAQLEREVDGLVAQGQDVAALIQQMADLAGQVTQVENAVATLNGGQVPAPAMQDLRGSLPRHASKQWPTRSTGDITQVVVHHTATAPDITPQRVAEFHVNQGNPGIRYHFMINGDGTTSWTESLEAITSQTAVEEVNRTGVAVTLAGDFTTAVPGDAQMASAARLVAWLLSTLNLDTGAVIGRSEVDSSDPSLSPGKQWLEGARYKDTLLAQVQAILDEDTAGDETVEALRRRIQALEAQVAELQAQADQVGPLQQEVQALRQQVDQQQAEIARLTAENGQLLAENARLWTTIQNLQGNAVQKPDMLDVVDTLPKHPTLPPYQNRTAAISRVVVHHTDTPPDFTPEQIAHYHVYGERRDAQGNLVKAQWPGIAYHYVIVADGTIYWTQRPETRSYHAGNANNDSLGVSLIGRFLRRTWDGTPIPPDLQLPNAAQMRSASQLIAWLMQEHGISEIERIVGHKEVSDTTCPGDQWLKGATWKSQLHRDIQAAAAGSAGKPIEHVLLFWDHGDSWAQSDWNNAQDYIAHFRPTSAFRTEDALLAQHVTIVGGAAGVSGEDEARLRAAGVDVHRLAGADETETKAMLDALVAKDTPWPDAPPRTPTPTLEEAPAEPARPDEWTVPDDYQADPVDIQAALEAVPPARVRVDAFGPSQPALGGNGAPDPDQP